MGKCLTFLVFYLASGGGGREGDVASFRGLWLTCMFRKTKVATGSAAGGSECFPEEPPVPLGYGTECEYPGETSADDIPVTSVTAT